MNAQDRDIHERSVFQLGDRHIVKSGFPESANCPGCGKIQPEEIQALEQMHNMDRPALVWGKTVMEQIKKDYEKMYAEVMKEYCVRGNGSNETSHENMV